MKPSLIPARAPEARRDLLKALLAAPAAATPIVPDPARRHEPFPLTEIQEAYWLGRDPAFLLGGVGIHGYFEVDCRDLDIARLEEAWNVTIRWHDMMRAVVRPDGTAQVLEQVPLYRIPVEDLSGLDPAARATRLAALREALSHRVYDVTRWPLFDIRALRLPDGTVRLLYSEDAIHIDLASSAIVMRDWLALYRGETLPPLPALSYRDYALALAARRNSPTHRQAVAAWRARLPDLPDPPDLPQRPGGAVAMRFARRKTTLAPPEWSAFRRRAAARDLTASDALLAAYADVLGAWSARPCFLLNVTIQNRLPLHPDVPRIVGDFTSFTLLDVDLGGDRTFSQRAAGHRARLWRDLDDGEVSGVTVLRELGAAQGGGTAPFVYTSALGTPGYRAIEELGTLVHEVTQTPQVLVDQQVLEVGGALVVTWDAVEDAFADGVIAAMFESLEASLHALATTDAAWDQRGPLPLPHGQRETRERVNATAGPFPQERLETLFLRQAAARGPSTALIDEAGAMSFRDLDARSLNLAAALQEAGAGPGRPVAIALPKGRGQIVAALAILRAGAPYLAFDPASPPGRTARLLAAAGCAHAVVDPDRPVAVLPEGVRRIPVGAAGRGSLRPTAGDGTAYVLFTSGSTGEPKGVPITHAAVVNRMDDVAARFAVGPDDRGLALTALHHDLSVFDIFGLLAVAGASVVIPPPTAAGPGDPREWASLMARHGVTIWNSVPGFMAMLLAAPVDEAAFARLRLVLLSGDWIPVGMPDAIRRRAPQARVVALGGPTETAVWDICCPDEVSAMGWRSIPYGRPMRNARYTIRREDLSECPDWVTGELCIAGIGVTRGYLAPTPEDAARFVTDPATGERLYRSGDLGRMRPDGLIEILGRKDRQVKVGGVRVELGDVEAALRRRPDVGGAVAFTVETASGATILAAAVTSAPSGSTALQDVVKVPAASMPVGGVRRSALAFGRRPLAAGEFARLLSVFRPIRDEDGRTRRFHPSAGAHYAVKVFAHVAEGRVSGLRGGLYALDPDEGRLRRLGGPARLTAEAHAPRNRRLAEEAALTLLLAAQPDQLAGDYGEAWRELGLIEAGYMGQLAAQAAAAYGLALCPLGGIDLAAAGVVLPDGHAALHALLLGTDPAAALGPMNAAPSLDETELRTGLAENLPPSMVPAVLLSLAALPLTANGKPDVEALRQLAACRADATPRMAERPSAAMIERVHAVVADVLGLTAVPHDRRLREIGATSVDMVRIHARLQEEGFALALTDLFAFPTVALLAEALGGGRGPAGGTVEVARARGAARREVIERLGRRRGDD